MLDIKKYESYDGRTEDPRPMMRDILRLVEASQKNRTDVLVTAYRSSGLLRFRAADSNKTLAEVSYVTKLKPQVSITGMHITDHPSVKRVGRKGYVKTSLVRSTSAKTAAKVVDFLLAKYTADSTYDDANRLITKAVRKWEEEPVGPLVDALRRDAGGNTIKFAKELVRLHAQGVAISPSCSGVITPEVVTGVVEGTRREQVLAEASSAVNARGILRADGTLAVHYASSNKIGTTPVVYASLDSAPEVVRQNVTMLKLVETDKFFEGVGVRVNDYWFGLCVGDYTPPSNGGNI